MAWLKRDAHRSSANQDRTTGWFRRANHVGRSSVEPDTTIVTSRAHPGNVTSRTVRNDVYQDALRAAESTLRNTTRRK